MRAILLGGLAAAAMIGTANANEGDGYSLYVGASHTMAEAEAGGLEAEADASTLSGAVAFDLRGRFQAQVDAQYTDADGYDEGIVGGSFHLVMRQPGWMVGGFVGGVEADDLTTLAYGAEGAMYFGRFTLAGAAAILDPDTDGDGFLYQVEGRYFFDRNFRVDATATFASTEVAGVDTDASVLGLGAEYQFSQSHVSVFGAVSRLEIDDVDLTADQITLGVRLNLDADLATRDESGASMISVPSFGTLF